MSLEFFKEEELAKMITPTNEEGKKEPPNVEGSKSSAPSNSGSS
jgi:hypothetical protein